MEKKEPLHIFGRHIDWFNLYRKQFIKILKLNLPFYVAMLLSDINPKNTKSLIPRNGCPLMFTVALVTSAKVIEIT